MSITRSAACMTFGSCSTTSSVLPASRSRCMTPTMRPTSRACRPMEGSSRTNRVLTSEVPSAVVRLIRCTSPPDRVRDWRSRSRYPSPTSVRYFSRVRISRSSRSVASSSGARQGEGREELAARFDRHEHQFADVDAGIAEPPQQRLGFQTRAAARRAFGVRAVSREQHPDVHLVRLGLEPGKESLHAVPDVLGPLSLAVEHPRALGVGEVAPRRVDGNRALAREFQEIRLAFLVRLGLPGFDRTLAQRQRRIRYDQAVIDTDAAAEAAAGVAGADRGIEAEGARTGILVRDVAVGAMQSGGKSPRRSGGLASPLCG